MEQPIEQTVEISDVSSVGLARQTARAAAEQAGFEPQAREEIILAASELSTNLLKHAKRGLLSLTRLTAGGRVGLQIEVADDGPGISSITDAMTDGFSTTGGMGSGLGAANRLMDEFAITSERGGGTHVVCRKWIRSYGTPVHPCPLSFGVATRPHPRCDVNGDAFVLREWSESALLGVIDGLGHGPGAFLAAQTARQYVESHFDSPLEEIFSGTGNSCRNTRGVVMALARFDWGQGKLRFASIGDIESRVESRATVPPSFAIRRGIIGLNAPKAVVTEHPWPPEATLVLHSDGVRSHWKWNDFPGLLDKSADAIAHELLRNLAKEEDDATVMVVRKQA